MVHKTDVAPDLRAAQRTEVVRADLGDPGTLPGAVEGVDAIVHFAGVLFKARPETFLPVTNTQYFRNLVDAATSHGVKKVVLISFPHVEGPTTIEEPAQGRLDGTPISVHAKTRLDEERYLFDHVDTPISLRVGMVYGTGILMIDAAKWLSRRWLLGIWREPTQIHLISKLDFCTATTKAVESPAAKGIYHLGDDGNITLQEFLDLACRAWGTKTPWRMPLWMIDTAAGACERVSGILNVRSPLTRDFISIGRVPYYGDTARMKQDLLPHLEYPSMHEGLGTLTLAKGLERIGNCQKFYEKYEDGDR
jgi:nucleoside-diphosphate-sugar epimerase